MNENLWDTKINKTKKVIELLDTLEPIPNVWKQYQIKKFNKEIRRAKNCSTANEMLEIIGYRPKRRPKLYDVIDDMEEK